MNNFFKYVPGFRTGVMWKRVIAVIYYVISLILLITVGLGAFLMTITIPFVIFSFISAITNEGKSKLFVIFISGVLLFIVGFQLNRSWQIQYNANQQVIAQQKVTDEATAIQNKKDEDVALAAKVIQDKKDADAQAVLAKQTADAKAAADKIGYDTGITYDQLARNPNKYIASKVKLSGKVIQVIEGTSEIDLRVAVGDNYDNILLVAYNPSIVTSRILENDEVTVKGVSQGITTYKSTMGGDITVPSVTADSFN